MRKPERRLYWLAVDIFGLMYGVFFLLPFGIVCAAYYAIQRNADCKSPEVDYCD